LNDNDSPNTQQPIIYYQPSNIGNIMVIVIVVMQSLMFIFNAMFKLSLNIEQLWFPFIALMGIYIIGLIGGIYK